MIRSVAAIPVAPLRSNRCHVLGTELLQAGDVDALVHARFRDGNWHEEEVGLGGVRGHHAARHQRLLEELLAGVVPGRHLVTWLENQMERVLAIVRVDEDAQAALHFGVIGLKNSTGMVGSIVFLLVCTQSKQEPQC